MWNWDDIVPAVLPPERRLLKESCEDIAQRFYTCPQSEKCPLRKPAEPAQPCSGNPPPPPVPTSVPTTPALSWLDSAATAAGKVAGEGNHKQNQKEEKQ